MNAIGKFLVFVSLILSFQTHAQSKDSEVDMKVQSRVGKTYLGVLKDGKMAAVICSKDFFGNWSADLVFSVRQSDDKVPELTLETYRSFKMAANAERRSKYVQLTSEAATQFCANPATEYVFKVDNGSAMVSRTVEPPRLEASSD